VDGIFATGPVSELGFPFIQFMEFSPSFVIRDGSTSLVQLTSQKPEEKSQRTSTLVVSWESDVNVTKHVICVNKGGNRKACSNCLIDDLAIGGRVCDEDD
jgi:hypothetical protein